MNLYAEIVAYEARALLKAQTLHGVGPESVGYAARDDVGAALASVLTGEGHNGAIYEITGPDRVIWPQKAVTGSEATGLPFRSTGSACSASICLSSLRASGMHPGSLSASPLAMSVRMVSVISTPG